MLKADKNTILYGGYVNKKEGIIKDVEIIKLKEDFKIK